MMKERRGGERIESHKENGEVYRLNILKIYVVNSAVTQDGVKMSELDTLYLTNRYIVYLKNLLWRNNINDEWDWKRSRVIF